jgi:hypothetical protein
VQTIVAALALAYRILDPLPVTVVTADPPARIPRQQCDIVILGGGMGGVSAAIAASNGGVRVCMTEPTKWIGGQMTAQGVSAFDENRFIETTGATRSYADLRQRIRTAYGGAANPGACWVSALCFEPQVGLDALKQMLPASVKLYLRTAPVAAAREGNRVRSVTVYNFDTKTFTELTGTVFIDATELGDVLPMVGAAAPFDPATLQAFTYPFILQKGAGPPIPKPPTYDRDQQNYTLTLDYGGGKFITYAIFEKTPGSPGSFWNYRRINAEKEIAMINWPGNDVCDGGYLSEDPEVAARAFRKGKEQALGFAWWVANQASPLTLRTDMLGTSDGLSQYPYIRESRQLKAIRTVREQEIANLDSPSPRAVQFSDSAGIGFYAMDIHGCGKNRVQRLDASKPFQIPFGALIAENLDNLLAGAKNLGATHIAASAYRLHPTEWAIGEAVGTLAAESVKRKRTPAAIYHDPNALRAVQRKLLENGHPLVWYDDVPLGDPEFFSLQWGGLAGSRPLDPKSLHGKH